VRLNPNKSIGKQQDGGIISIVQKACSGTAVIEVGSDALFQPVARPAGIAARNEAGMTAMLR
jgi:hypothetical protein